MRFILKISGIILFLIALTLTPKEYEIFHFVCIMRESILLAFDVYEWKHKKLKG